ncbi:MAG: PDZ domain-containing protein [candidate division Zixibacteria bacterium]
MLDPTDYGAFIALNGHMGVASQDGGIPTFPVNFFNSPVYAVTTFRDALYPSSQMRKGIEMANKAGGRVFYRERDGVHNFDYAEEELPLIADFLNNHPRDPLPSKIIWESSDRRFGQCFWLAIDGVSEDQPTRWHKRYNAEIIDSSITIGFFPDDTFAGPGVLAGGIAGEEYLAGKMGLLPGDIIVGGNRIEIEKIGDINAFKSTIRYGDPVTIVVMRDDKKIELRDSLPEPRTTPLLKYADNSSAIARATFYGNIVEIESSRLRSFRILINPDMFNIEQNLKVIVDGDIVYDKPIEPDPKFMLWNFWENLDRGLLYISEIEISL